MAVEGHSRPAWAEVDRDALRANAAVISERLAPAALCAVVKADGYGHGAITAARAFLDGGAKGLAIAIVDEGLELRAAGITAPILLLSEPPPDSVDAAVDAGLTLTLATPAGVAAAKSAARRAGGRIPVHIKVDTGMHRMGVEVEHLDALLEEISGSDELVIEGLWTHLSVADESDEDSAGFTATQLERLEQAVEVARARGLEIPIVHAANSAGGLSSPDARLSMVRSGLALYGEVPNDGVRLRAEGESPLELRPALTIKAAVSAVRQLKAGDRPSYGRRRPLATDATVATVPIGYADGFPRALFEAGAEVLIGGKRHPLAGMVTMDQIVVDVGTDEVAVGDEVVLLGRQGDEEITAREWASHLGTITYEVLCGIGPRVPRREVGAPSSGGATSADEVPRRRWGRRG